MKSTLLVLAALLSVALPSLNAETPAPPVPRIVIIKADDIRGETPQLDNFIALAREKHIKVSLGVICDSLEQDSDGKYSRWLAGLVKAGDIELWHHGWDHSKKTVDGAAVWEFSRSGLPFQKEHLKKALALLREKTGVTMTTFGAPYNAMDADTAAALNDIPGLTGVFCYPAQSAVLSLLRGKVLLPMTLRGEADGTGKPNFEKFKQDYAKRDAGLHFAAIQFHPPYFTAQGLVEFGQIVDFLKAEGWVFELPAEYIGTQSSKTVPLHPKPTGP